MSVEILYGRQFVDLGNGEIIPLILSGSSNCTEYIGGREVFERHWWPLDNLHLTPDKLLADFKDGIKDGRCHEYFVKGSRGGQWIDEKNVVKWIEKGIKHALSIEDIRKYRPGTVIDCSVYEMSQDLTKPSTQSLHKNCSSTEELLSWVEAYEKCVPQQGYTKYPLARFNTREPLALDNISRLSSGPVVCKVGHLYLLKVDQHSFTCTKNKTDALVFKNKEDFESQYLERMSRYKHSLVPISTRPKPEGRFAIKQIKGGHVGAYFKRGTKSGCQLTYNVACSKKFVTERTAREFANICSSKYENCLFQAVPIV